MLAFRVATKLTVLIVGFVTFGAVLTHPPFTAPAGAQGRRSETHTVFASVLAKDGSPITDLTAADFKVREGGKLQSIADAKIATMPLRVHIIVSDAGTGAFQLGVLRLMQALSGRAEFALTSVLGQSQRIMNFTADGEMLGDGIQKIGRRGSRQGTHQVMEAISNAVADLAAPGKHPVLIVLRVGNEEPSTMVASTVREALRKSGATMYVVSRAGASKPVPTYSGPGNTDEAARRQMDDAERAHTSLNLNLVLGDGSRESGGYQQESNLTSAVPALERLASEISNQYEITYSLTEGAKPSGRIEVTTTRKNVTLRAPTRIPN
jgi:VWFA-related protein